MMVSPNRRLAWLPVLALLVIALGVTNCVAPTTESVESADSPMDPPGPSMNHAAHLAKNLECATCHDPEESGDPKMPVATTCWDCHDEDLTDAPEKFKAYFQAIRQDDGTYAFPRVAWSSDLIFEHPAHTKAGVACADCHGEAKATGFSRGSVRTEKATCQTCHEERGASLECATCHREIRRDQAPESHGGDFPRAHGKKAPADWRLGEGGLCAQCHEVPDGCDRCHRESRPSSHAGAGFSRFHGRDALDIPYRESTCSLCHEEQSCAQCHQTQRPRSHTTSFERRLHGLAASVERMSCLTCHKQDFCDSCHQTTLPISHTGSFASGRQTHCVGCHDPLPTNGCYTCHKNTLGHLRATSLPPGPPHATATDCRTCHSVLPHLDDGGNCRRCHR